MLRANGAAVAARSRLTRRAPYAAEADTFAHKRAMHKHTAWLTALWTVTRTGMQPTTR
jgi:hypothetical protein